MNRGAKKIARIVLFSTFLLFILGYGLFRAKNILVGVKIKNVAIEQKDGIVDIAGNASHSTNLYLQGREISINREGNFEETFALLPGYNIVEIEAKDKFGNRDQKTYQLIYEKEYGEKNNQEPEVGGEEVR